MQSKTYIFTVEHRSCNRVRVPSPPRPAPPLKRIWRSFSNLVLPRKQISQWYNHFHKMLTRWIFSSPRGTASPVCLVSVCLPSLDTEGLLHPLPTLKIEDPVPQVLKQVVNLSCYSLKSIVFIMIRS